VKAKRDEGMAQVAECLPSKCKTLSSARCQWLTSVILVTQEERIRIVVQGQPGQIVLETLSGKNSSKKRAGGVAPGVGPEFKP
jgi:hypothetical protein